MWVVAAIPTAANAALEEDACRQAEHHHPAPDVSQDDHDDHEGGGVEEAAEHRPADFAQGHVVCVERGGQHRVVEMGDLELEEHVEDGIDHRPVHGRGGQQRRRHKGRIGHLGVSHLDRTDQPAEPDADGQQEQEWLQHSGKEEDPMTEVETGVPLEQQQGPSAAEGRDESRRQGGAEPVRTSALHRHCRRGHGAGVFTHTVGSTHCTNLRPKVLRAKASPTALQAAR